MHDRRPGGDIHGDKHGDYTDWDNPEDEAEDSPEGYYDEEGGEDAPTGGRLPDSYVPGPADPDYDLSEAAGYRDWEAPKRDTIIPSWLIVAISILLILAILAPVALQAR
jgi:hypothetical protein